MLKGLSIFSSAALAVLLVTGLAGASPDEPQESSSTTTSTTATAAEAGRPTFAAAHAGQVTLGRVGTSLSVTEVRPDDGWVHEVEAAAGREVEVTFANGSERVDFQAELEDGTVKTRVRTSSLEGADDSGADQNEATVAFAGSLVFDAGEAGTVRLEAETGGLRLISATPNAGWIVADVETEGIREINVEFRNGSTEVEFKAEIDDGAVKTRVRIETDSDDDEHRSSEGGNASESSEMERDGTDD